MFAAHLLAMTPVRSKHDETSREMMKTKVALVLSLSGVLAAGTAAALVNTRVLNGGSTSGVSAAAPKVLETPGAATTAPTPTTAVPGTVGAVLPTQATYSIGQSGTVTLDTAGDALTVAAVAPASGWIVTQSGSDDASNAAVTFQSGTIEVEFHANLVFGVVRTSVDSHDLSTTNTSVGGNSGFDDHQSGDDDGRGGDDDGGGGDD